MPSSGIVPSVTLSPTTPFHAAGRRTDPPVSEPIAKGTSPAATATPEPLEDPPGVRWTFKSQGLTGVPRCWLVPHPPIATSTVWVLPIRIPPALSSLSVIIALHFGKRPISAAEPPVVSWPATSTISFSANGTPVRGPRGYPRFTARSATSASARASSS